jgi:hypothetical protein
MNFKTTTPKTCEGFNISYSDEEKCAKSLLSILPKNWHVDFSWSQILFADVQYRLDKKKKTVYVVYNQNLHIWWKDLMREVATKLDLKEKATSPEVA